MWSLNFADERRAVAFEGYLKSGPEMSDLRLVIDEGVAGPQAPSQLLARDGLSRTLEQGSEGSKGLFLNADASAGFAELARPQVQFEHAEPDDRSSRRGGRAPFRALRPIIQDDESD
jgi:hypothetical protein